MSDSCNASTPLGASRRQVLRSLVGGSILLPGLLSKILADEAKSDPAPARAGGGGGGGGGRGGGRMGGAPPTAMTIKQTAGELTMDRTTAQGAQTVVLKLDGSESKNTIGMGPAVSKAMWDGPRLVVTTTQTAQGRGGEITIDSKEIYSVAGNTLTARSPP